MKYILQRYFPRWLRILSIILITIFSLYALFIYKCNKECVAYYLLDKFTIAPILFEDTIYFQDYSYVPVYDRRIESEVLGNIEFWSMYPYRKGNTYISSYLSYILLNKIAVDLEDTERNNVFVTGFDNRRYTKASLLEDESRMKALLEEYDDYILLDTHRPRKSYIIPKQLVVDLEKEYGKCDYDIQDFVNMSPQYYINADFYAKEQSGPALEPSMIYVAILFYKDGDYYYCNSNNKIQGELLERLSSVWEEAYYEKTP